MQNCSYMYNVYQIRIAAPSCNAFHFYSKNFPPFLYWEKGKKGEDEEGKKVVLGGGGVVLQNKVKIVNAV